EPLQATASARFCVCRPCLFTPGELVDYLCISRFAAHRGERRVCVVSARTRAPARRMRGSDMPANKPKLLASWGDDIGNSDRGWYSRGLMGYSTPNIDRMADEGIVFTDSYGEQSCTAGRSSFITGQSVYRTGLSKVGMPGADIGLSADDPTIAELL